MGKRRLTWSLVLLGWGCCHAGIVYEVTVGSGDGATRYEVQFGGGMSFDEWTAFDPETRKFVYLQWPRGKPAPKPEARIWDHRSGETIDLYRFPGVAHPLPVIPSIEAMRVCPLTGGTEMRQEILLLFD